MDQPRTFRWAAQFFDPQSNVFIEEGAWTPVAGEVAPGAAANFEISIPFPPEAGAYEIYVSHIQPPDGWAYARGEPFLRILVEAVRWRAGQSWRKKSPPLRSLRWRRIWAALPKLFASPVRTIGQNHRLIRSMARRDILARYRGSFGDVFWTVLNPLLLMATYFFVFGIVLQSRVPGRSEPHRFRALFSRRDAALARVFGTRGTRRVRDSGASQFRQEAGVSARYVAGKSSACRIGHRAFWRRSLHRRHC